MLGNRSSEGGGQRHSIGGEGLWQQTHFPKVKEACPPFVINAEVARVHIGLCEDQSLMANADRRCWPDPMRDPRDGLAQLMC